MSSEESQADRPYLAPYEKATREMGAGFESQLWMSKDAQRTRFEILTQLGRFKDRIVADLGCGVGDLPMYLHEHAIDQYPKSYIGIEGVDAMAEHARARIADAGIDRTIFDLGDFVADKALADMLVNDAGVEVFVFSGSLNTLDMRHAQTVLDEFWKALLDWALERTPIVQLRHEYLRGHDATIVMDVG